MKDLNQSITWLPRREWKSKLDLQCHNSRRRDCGEEILRNDASIGFGMVQYRYSTVHKLTSIYSRYSTCSKYIPTASKVYKDIPLV